MVNLFGLHDQNIVITGASSGIGRQCAITCSRLGAKTFLLARNEDRLQRVKMEIGDAKCEFYIIDLENFNEYERVIEKIVSNHGKISGLIHSAGVDVTMPHSSLRVDSLRDVYDRNTLAFFEMVRFVSRRKYCREVASYVAISSVMSVLAQRGKLAYCASKAALVSGAKVLALELASKNIRVNCVSPAIVKTPLVDELFSKLSHESIRSIENMHPMGFGNPDDIANACAFLLSDASRWITGTNLIVDGGYSLQ